MSKIRIGIAGANGAFGSKHMDAISTIEDAEITAVMATSMAKADSAADRLVCRIGLMILTPFWHVMIWMPSFWQHRHNFMQHKGWPRWMLANMC